MRCARRQALPPEAVEPDAAEELMARAKPAGLRPDSETA
jgi:hypothetical protein